MRVSIQQVLRIGVSILWILANLAAFLSHGNMYVNTYSLVSANILFLTYFILASSVNISLVIYNIVGLFFVLQRCLLIFAGQDNFAFLGPFTIDVTSFELALVFICIANLFIILIAKKYRKPFCESPIYHSKFMTDVIRYYPIVFIILLW